MTTYTKPRKFYPIYQALLATEWREHRTDAGRCFAKDEGNQCIVLNLREIILKDRQKIELNWFLHSKELFGISQRISPNKLMKWLPLTAMIENPPDQQDSLFVLDTEEFTFAQAEKLIEKVIGWGRSVDPNQTIRSIASSPIPDVGGAQLKYLASLAYVGDFNTLMDYQEIFRKGQRMNFVPMIKPEMIDRAVDIALERT
ncbi:DUF6990 domain-containing protein [Celeribacter sp. SCSIO 80788]|jgi:hypothetical protein|uniref:DUF6990 domain-containing protein n=1 Tax=Celeribacter sp. SCSIO 80788 TaxID=3117013 RepID=UPI003DA5FF03